MGVGLRLVQAREQRGLSLDDIATRTRIAPRILRSMERDNFAAIPGGIFARGYLRAYALAVDLDPEEIVAQYTTSQAAAGDPLTSPSVASTPAPRASAEGWVFSSASVEYGLVGVTVVLVLTAFYWRPHFTFGRQASSGSTQEQTAQQVTASESSANRIAPPAAPALPPQSAPSKPPRPTDEIRVALTATQDVWVGAYADNQRVLYRLLKPSENVSLTAKAQLKIRAGNAGALLVSLNGETAAPVGGVGEVRDLSFSRRADGTIAR